MNEESPDVLGTRVQQKERTLSPLLNRTIGLFGLFPFAFHLLFGMISFARDAQVDSTLSLNISLSEIKTRQKEQDTSDNSKSASAALTGFTRFSDTGYGRVKGDRLVSADLTATAADTVFQTQSQTDQRLLDSVQTYNASTTFAISDQYPRGSMRYSVSAGLSTSPLPPEFDFKVVPQLAGLRLARPVQTYTAALASNYSLSQLTILSSGASVSLSGSNPYFTTLNFNLGLGQSLSEVTSLQAGLGTTLVQNLISTALIASASLGLVHAFSESFSSDAQLSLIALPDSDQTTLDYRAGGSVGSNYRKRFDSFRLAASRGVTPRRVGGALYFADSVAGTWRHSLTELQYLSSEVTYRREITAAGLADNSDNSAESLIEALTAKVSYGIGIVTSHAGKSAPIGSLGQVQLVLAIESGIVSSTVQNQSRTAMSANVVVPF